jgi:ribosome modulation factor
MRKSLSGITYNNDFKYQHNTDDACPFTPENQELQIYNGWHENCNECMEAAANIGYEKPTKLTAIKRYLRNKFYSVS